MKEIKMSYHLTVRAESVKQLCDKSDDIVMKSDELKKALEDLGFDVIDVEFKIVNVRDCIR